MQMRRSDGAMAISRRRRRPSPDQAVRLPILPEPGAISQGKWPFHSGNPQGEQANRRTASIRRQSRLGNSSNVGCFQRDYHVDQVISFLISSSSCSGYAPPQWHSPRRRRSGTDGPDSQDGGTVVHNCCKALARLFAGAKAKEELGGTSDDQSGDISLVPNRVVSAILSDFWIMERSIC